PPADAGRACRRGVFPGRARARARLPVERDRARAERLRGRRPPPPLRVARLPARPPRRDGARQAGLVIMDTGRLAMPRRIAPPAAATAAPPISHTRIAMVVVTPGASMLFAGRIGMFFVLRLS